MVATKLNMCLQHDEKHFLLNLWKLKILKHGRYDATGLEKVNKTKAGRNQVNVRGSARKKRMPEILRK